ncbi:TIGR01620 family protein [Pseudidiomarina aestuarii]|nr:TIGR01620 family protein [Pseudidiomarina aestuarii]
MTESSKRPQVQYYEADDFVAPEPSPAVELTDTLPSRFVEQPRQRRWRGWLALGMGVIGLLLVVEAVLFILASWRESWLLGALWSLALSIVVIIAGGWLVREWWLLRKLRKRWQQRDANQQRPETFRPEQLLPQLGHPDLYAHWAQFDRQGLQQEEQLQLFEQQVLHKVDQQAERIISDHALQSALLVAVSPIALVDAGAMLWRNQRMVTAIAKCYGLEMGYWSRMRLWRQLFVNIVGIGVTEVAIDLSTSWLDASVASKLSARAGQGVAAGLLTARLGLQAQQLCRPLIFQYTQAPRLSVIRKHMMQRLMHQVPQFWRSAVAAKQPVSVASSQVEK